MPTYKCLVNGGIDAATRAEVTAGLARLAADRFGISSDAVTVSFTEIPPGRWFTAGRPSSASMVLSSVPAGTDQATREAVMEEICALWSRLTGADYHHVMVVAADEPDPQP